MLAKASEEVYQEQETVSSQETSMNESFQNPEQPVISTPAPTETPAKEKKKVVSKKVSQTYQYCMFFNACFLINYEEINYKELYYGIVSIFIVFLTGRVRKC